MKIKNKIEKFLNLYKELINSTNYNEILDNINIYSKLKLENKYKNLKFKWSKLRYFFKTQKLKNLTKENLIIILKEIKKQELYFDKENFSSMLEQWNISYKKNWEDKTYKKSWVIWNIESLIHNLVFDFEYLIKYWNEKNQIEFFTWDLRIL